MKKQTLNFWCPKLLNASPLATCQVFLLIHNQRSSTILIFLRGHMLSSLDYSTWLARLLSDNFRSQGNQTSILLQQIMRRRMNFAIITYMSHFYQNHFLLNNILYLIFFLNNTLQNQMLPKPYKRRA